MTVTRIEVAVEGSPYEVLIGEHLLKGLGQHVKRVAPAPKVALVTDGDVAEIYGHDVDSELSRAGFQTYGFTVPAGEGSKRWETAGALVEGFAEVGLSRTDVCVGLGGGVITDLAGFAAAVYLRGIDFVSVPTTLLGMVDAAVGGKTGVDLSAGKNLAGAFKQPKLVVMDTTTLSTLPEPEWRSGLAEVAKSAIIEGEDFMTWLETHAEALVARDPEAVEEAVVRCVRFKAGVVAGDEREGGARECLNYGHTLGHAIEKCAGFGAVPHGVAVAEGIRFAARLAEDVVGAGAEFVARQDALLDALGLAPLAEGYGRQALFNAMRADKKSRDGQVRFVLATAPGSWTCAPVDEDVIYGYLDAWATSKEPAAPEQPIDD